MAFKKTVELKINNSNSTITLSHPLVFYEDDRGIDIYFKIKEQPYMFSNPEDMLENVEGFFSVTIVNPIGVEISRDKLPIEDSMCKFSLTHDLTDELTEIGTYKMQIHITDTDANEDNQYSIPPFEFEVKEKLKGTQNIAVVDFSQADYSIVGDDEVATYSTETNDYTKTIWNSGDYITANKLNNMENGIENANEEVTDSEIDSWFDNGGDN